MDRRRLVLVLVLAAAALAAGAAVWRQRSGPIHYTGFVEGEERIVRSEVTGRVLEVAFGEGDVVAANAVIARIADEDVQRRLAAKRQQIAVQEADIRRQEEQVRLLESTWKTQLDAQRAELRQAEAGATLAARTLERERALVRSGASTAQLLDEARAGHDQARSLVERARDLVARQEAQERQIAVARRQLEVLRAQRDLAAAELAELEVVAAKYVIRAPAVATTVQTKFLWPGELAQPGSAVLAVLDPTDKYVQIYVPVADMAAVRVGDRVEIELDSAPGRRVPGEVAFLADQATFTPEKIESRSDRMGQVYRAKVRILADVERFQPGTEGDVYLVAGSTGADGTAATATPADARP
ncbi:MAG: HlyD family efflux transporter periplasmic adaptor subunit [Deltaproteobacteria bacterium]|nr:HlyD family efflux transporter periplasmic adaptor subunit [Deltaproteobacteria bacterium]